MDNTSITSLLGNWRRGNRDAAHRLAPLVFDELHALAHRSLTREKANHTLQTTALVNEAWMRLAGQHRIDWQNRKQFYGVAACMMRRILTDHARERAAARRGNGIPVFSLQDSEEAGDQTPVTLTVLDDALTDLERIDPLQCRLVELRFYAGLTMEEVAGVLKLSLAKAKMEWRMARAWLYDYMKPRKKPA